MNNTTNRLQQKLGDEIIEEMALSSHPYELFDEPEPNNDTHVPLQRNRAPIGSYQEPLPWDLPIKTPDNRVV